MPENINTSSLSLDGAEEHESAEGRPSVIKVDHVSMVFNMASEQLNSLKEYAIKLARRELYFEGFTALDDVSFEVKKGDVFGIMGTNGSGKSTLLKIIAGVLEPTKGSCEINGNIAPLIELGAGFDTELSARENIYLNGALLGYSKQFIKDHFDEIVDFAEIEKFLDMPLKNYSSGMVARIAFAIATVIVPEVLIVDEVLSVGDFMFQKKCEDRITELIERHDVTVLIVSHSNDQIERLCNKAIWIEKGHTRLMGDAAMVCRVYSGLGGRTGSAQSEHEVFEALRRLGEEDLPRDAYTMIDGDSYYGTAVKAAVRGWKEDPSCVVLACDSTHVNTVVASGLAGACRAPIIPVKASCLPETVEQYLLGIKPLKIFLLDKDRSSHELHEQLLSLPWNPEIMVFPTEPGSLRLSSDVFNYGQSRGFWGKSALLAYFECNIESFVATALSYQKNLPFFVLAQDEADDAELLVNTMAHGGIEEALAIGPADYRQLCKALEQAGIATSRLACDSGQDGVLELASAALHDKEAAVELCMGSQLLGQWPELLPMVGYVGKCGGAMLLEDLTDLDNVATRMRFIAENRSAIASLTFFGGQSVLSATDQFLLYRAWRPIEE